MDTVALISQLESDSARIGEVLVHLDPDAPVTTCPGWNVRDLIHHLSCTQRWATDIVAEAKTHKHWMDLSHYHLAADDDLSAWFTQGANRLADVLTDAPEDLDCWVFMADVRSPLHFWARRQAHETAVHRVDVEAVAGQLTGFGLTAAADGLDELLTGFMTRPNRGPRADIASSVGFVALNHDGRWTVVFDRDSCRSTRSLDGDQVQATVHANVEDLFAWAWDRPAIGPVAIEGDAEAVARFKATG